MVYILPKENILQPQTKENIWQPAADKRKYRGATTNIHNHQPQTKGKYTVATTDKMPVMYCDNHCDPSLSPSKSRLACITTIIEYKTRSGKNR